MTEAFSDKYQIVTSHRKWFICLKKYSRLFGDDLLSPRWTQLFLSVPYTHSSHQSTHSCIHARVHNWSVFRLSKHSDFYLYAFRWPLQHEIESNLLSISVVCLPCLLIDPHCQHDLSNKLTHLVIYYVHVCISSLVLLREDFVHKLCTCKGRSIMCGSFISSWCNTYLLWSHPASIYIVKTVTLFFVKLNCDTNIYY